MRRRRSARPVRRRSARPRRRLAIDLQTLMEKVDEIVVDISNSGIEDYLRDVDLNDYESLEELLEQVQDFQMVAGGLEGYVKQLDAALSSLLSGMEEPEY